MASKLFQSKDIADAYANFRPNYPEDLTHIILDYVRAGSGINADLDLAVDIGCGSGQSTITLKGYFNQVLGIDVSAAQIERAPKHTDNVRFEVGSAYKIPVLDGSVNLATIAQTLHWLNTEDFYTEINRVLKPNGTLAVYGYGNVTVDKSDAADLVYNEVINIIIVFAYTLKYNLYPKIYCYTLRKT